MAELRFEAMGTWAHVVVVGGPTGGCERVRARVDDLERRWSRFLPDSEVSRLNRSDGVRVVSPETAALLARAAEAYELTGGRFDPYVLPAVVAAGYDRSFDLLDREPGLRGPNARPGLRGPNTRPGLRGPNAIPGLVRLTPATGFDPGGIGKGMAADLVVAELQAGGAEGVCVNLGGDLRVEGIAPGCGPWVVDVEDPFGTWDRPLLRLGLERGAVATSSRLKRAWTVAGEGRHHLIDPSTGRPAASDAVAVTVIAGAAWRAEALATAVAVAGVSDGLELLERLGATGLVVDERGTVHHAAGLAPYLE